MTQTSLLNESLTGINNSTFTTLVNDQTKFTFDDKHKLSTFNDDSYISKLATVTTQSLSNQVNKTQDAITQPNNESNSNILSVGSNVPNDKLIAGRILAEARAASKGISPTINNINIATGTINELTKLKDSTEVYQKASQTERDGKVTDNISTLIEGGQKVAQGVVDLMVPLLKGSPGVSIVGNDTINFGANRGISINSRGAVTTVSPQHNVHTSLNTTTSEVSVEKVGLKSQESETRVNSSKNNIDKSVNNVQIHSSVETVSNNYTLYSKDLIQTVTENKLDSFLRGETQGNDLKYSIDKTMLYTIGDTFTLGVGNAPQQEKKPGFGVDDLLNSVTGKEGGSILTISPSLYSLQQQGKVSVQSSGLQSNIANKIANIATEKVVNMSKQDVLSIAMGTEFRMGSSTGFSTFMGFGSTVIGNFNIIGNLMGFISGISDIAGLIFPDLELPSQLPIPGRSEKVSLKNKINFEECLPPRARKKSTDNTTGSNTSSSNISDSVINNQDIIQGSESNDLPEYKDQEILDKLQGVYPEAGGLQLNKPKSKDKIEAITPETDTPLGIKSLPQTADPLQQPTTPHNTNIQTIEGGESLPNTSQGNVTTTITNSSNNNNTNSSNNETTSNTVLDKQSTSNSQPGVPKNPSSNTISNGIKARFAPHTYIDIYKEEDYFPDLNTSSTNNTKSTTSSTTLPSLKDYIDKSTTLSPEQKDKISNNLKTINEVLSNETNSANLSIALQNNINSLNDSEIDEILTSYLELNAAMAVGFGFLGDITAFFKDVTSVVTDVYNQVDKAASIFGLDIKGGVISSVMDIVDKVKLASNSSSISELLNSFSIDFDEFMPITTSLLGLIDGSKTKDDVSNSLSNSLSQVIVPLLNGITSNELVTNSIVNTVSSIITDGTILNRDKGDILNRIISILSSNGVVPNKVFEVTNALGNVIDGIQNGSLLPSLLGSGINSLFSTLNNAIDLSPVNKILNSINSIYGTVESLLSIPSMLQAMNDYDIPLLSQITSILDCVDVYSRLKDIVGIIKDPLGYEPQHTNSSLNLPTDISIDKLKNTLSEKLLGKNNSLTNNIVNGSTLNDFLTNITNSNGLDKLLNQVTKDNPFFLLPSGSSAYLQNGEQVDSNKFLINNKGDVLITNKDTICTLEDITLVSNKDVVGLDLSSIALDEGGVINSTTFNTSNKYIPEYKTKEYINRALQAGDLQPLSLKDKETNDVFMVDISLKNNPELITELVDKANTLHLKDPISNEEFIWSELNPTTVPNYIDSESIDSNITREEKPLILSNDIKGIVQHTTGTCKASIPELFQIIDKGQNAITSNINISTNSEEIEVLRKDINVQNTILLINNKSIDISSITYIEVTNKGYKLLSWNKN